MVQGKPPPPDLPLHVRGPAGEPGLSPAPAAGVQALSQAQTQRREHLLRRCPPQRPRGPPPPRPLPDSPYPQRAPCVSQAPEQRREHLLRRCPPRRPLRRQHLLRRCPPRRPRGPEPPRPLPDSPYHPRAPCASSGVYSCAADRSREFAESLLPWLLRTTSRPRALPRHWPPLRPSWTHRTVRPRQPFSTACRP